MCFPVPAVQDCSSLWCSEEGESLSDTSSIQIRCCMLFNEYKTFSDWTRWREGASDVTIYPCLGDPGWCFTKDGAILLANLNAYITVIFMNAIWKCWPITKKSCGVTPRCTRRSVLVTLSPKGGRSWDPSTWKIRGRSLAMTYLRKIKAQQPEKSKLGFLKLSARRQGHGTVLNWVHNLKVSLFQSMKNYT